MPVTSGILRRLAKLEAARRGVAGPGEIVFVAPVGCTDLRAFAQRCRVRAGDAPAIFVLPDNGRDPSPKLNVSAG